MDEESTQDATQTLSKLKDILKNPDPENMPYLNFESIKNPYEVMKIAKRAKNEIKQKLNQ